MKKTYCDICGEEMEADCLESHSENVADRRELMFRLLGVQDICKDCDTAFAAHIRRDELMRAMLQRRGLLLSGPKK